MSSIPPPQQWATGDEPMTEKQGAFLNKLMAEKGVNMDSEGISKSHASEMIDDLKKQSGGSSGHGATEKGGDSLLKNPSDWTTGDEAATSRQRGYVASLAKKAGEQVPSTDEMSKAEASETIDDLRSKTGQ
ncbi:hypothetical protein OE88DRAFT_1667512 [Heliocybe sulcata]|uniref:DUF3072 domain-containing protein n=1 Tax=Heliocybe sulcata TaxID=5364 RepID=A0A5C3MMN0_9AGAM|nr:hypothetical protein OE88DRAFT_1667512 [Heliocybe sulcata]